MYFIKRSKRFNFSVCFGLLCQLLIINKRVIMTLTEVMSLHKKAYFIGIGGSGMSGIAEVMMSKGFCVSGSDPVDSNVTDRLKKLGAIIHHEHIAKNVRGADFVIVSSAITHDNPEYVEAKKLRIPIIARAQMLAELMRFKHSIAIAGTHGKTTTTSMMAHVFFEGGCEPTFVVGGKLHQFNCNASLGQGRYLIAEADESDASFMHLLPVSVVVTNIDEDHLVTYDNDFNKLKRTFLEFIHNTPFTVQRLFVLMMIMWLI